MSEMKDYLSTTLLLYFDSLNSTNLKLKELNNEKPMPEYSGVITRDQFLGRGQMGNSWESEPGMNLTFSVLLRPTGVEIAQQFIISKLISVAIVEVLGDITGLSFNIKWPNDIYYQQKKVAGILIENSIMGSKISETVVGIGLNVNQKVFVSNAPNPISLSQITGSDYDVADLAVKILDKIVKYDTQVEKGQVLEVNENYFSHLFRSEGSYLFSDESGLFTATIKGLSPMGHLILLTKAGEERQYEFKEVEFVLD